MELVDGLGQTLLGDLRAAAQVGAEQVLGVVVGQDAGVDQAVDDGFDRAM